MMRLVVSLALIAPALAPAAEAATPLQPTKGWVLDYGETSCTALHRYGSAEAPVTLAFRPSPNGTVVRLMIVRPGRTYAATTFGLTVTIGARRFDMTGLRFPPPDHMQELFWINIPRDWVEGLRGTHAITLRGGSLDVTFPLPNMGGVLDGLAKCNDDLRRFWHVDEAGQANLSKPARPLVPLASYFSARDYPDPAISRQQGGSSRVMLMVDETGKARDCLVEKSSGIAALDAQTCAVLLERAKFAPALDASGKPTRSVLTQQVKWEIE